MIGRGVDHVWYQAGALRAAVVIEGMPCVAEGFMEAPAPRPVVQQKTW